MEYLWMVAGGIVGWISIEIVSSITKVPMPTIFNFGMLFVGGLVGYTFGG